MQSDLDALKRLQTLSELFAWRVAATPTREAYRQCESGSGEWKSYSWAEMGARVLRWREALSAAGLDQGARVAILLPNGVDAVCIDQAALAAGAVPVPLHSIDNPGSIAYILADCEASLLVMASAAQWQLIAAAGTEMPALQQVVIVGDDAAPAELRGAIEVVGLAQWLGKAKADAPLLKPPTESDLATVVYTSGTTGKPKGVMLTHAHVMANVKASLARVAPTADDLFLSFLPLSHTFERTAGYYLPIAIGCAVAYARSVPQLAEDLKIVRPTVLISVPRIYERVHAKVQAMLAPSPLKTALFNWTCRVGWRRFCAAQRLPCDAPRSAVFDPLVWPLLRALIAQPLLAQFGGRVRIAVSGGAALSPIIAQCFVGLGLPVLQGYGMTETSPVVAANGLNDNDPATVGRPLPGVEVRIGENRELQVRGPSVMKGYWKRPEDTARVMMEDGWLRSGDQAAIESGRIRILGRIKEIIVTSTGEKVPPADLELAISSDPMFEQALVVGENRPFIAAIVVLNRKEWEKLAGELNLDATAAGSLKAHSVCQALLKRITQLTCDFPRYAMPRAVEATLEPWTIENALMTPTLKLKRNNLMARFEIEIDALYAKRAV